MSRTREEAEKWLADTLARNARWGPHGLMGGGLLLLDTARALLDAGVTVPEPSLEAQAADFVRRMGNYYGDGGSGRKDFVPEAMKLAARLNAAEREKP